MMNSNVEVENLQAKADHCYDRWQTFINLSERSVESGDEEMACQTARDAEFYRQEYLALARQINAV